MFEMMRIILVMFFLPWIHGQPSQSNYEHDASGQSTYCWSSSCSGANCYAGGPTLDNQIAVGLGRQCPISISIKVDSQRVSILKPVKVKWTIRTDFSIGNNLNVTQLYDAPNPKIPNQRIQIPHSNVHACIFGSNCDPYFDGQNHLNPTANQVADFESNVAEFESDELVFSNVGVYSVLAHIILPGETDNIRYDYASFIQITASNEVVAESSSSSSGGTGVIIGSVVGALIVLGIIVVAFVYRQRKSNEHQNVVLTPLYDAPHSQFQDTGSVKGSVRSSHPETYKDSVPTAPVDSPHSNYGDPVFPVTDNTPLWQARAIEANANLQYATTQQVYDDNRSTYSQPNNFTSIDVHASSTAIPRTSEPFPLTRAKSDEFEV